MRRVILILPRPFALLVYLIVIAFVYLCAFLFEFYGNHTSASARKQARDISASCREFLLPPIA